MIFMQSRGFTMITGILLIMAVVLMGLIAISSLTWSSGMVQTYLQKGVELNSVLDACLDEAMLRFKQDPTFQATTLSLSGNSCTITVSTISGNSYKASMSVDGPLGEKLSGQATLQRIIQEKSVQIQLTNYKYL